MTQRDFLPVSKADMKKRGWDQLDFIYITGDAYVDHPSFGPAIISRILESHGYKVGIIPQPDWKDENSVKVLGTPRLGFLISGGNMDSMVNHYSVSKRRRDTDNYTPGAKMGKRPDYAVVVYGNLLRRVFGKMPIIIGGIEASLRRFGHYDYWSDSVKRSILLDSSADIISYGMGERSVVEIADALNAGIPVDAITFVEGTVYKTKTLESIPEYKMLPSFEEAKADKVKYAESFLIQYQNTDPFRSSILVEDYGNRGYIVQNTPAKPLSQLDMDDVYDLPYMRTYHPMYEKDGGIPAISEIKFSLVSNRGCFGSCSFCALTFHQGRIIQTRSHDSIVKEANILTKDPQFKGYIHDVGGPTADFRAPSCEKQLKVGTCANRQCLFPTPCKNLRADHRDYLSLLHKLRAVPGVKKVFIRSGIRFDYVLADKDQTFLRELCEHHVSGLLKVAPEHISPNVLRYMGKPDSKVFLRFADKYKQMNEKLGLKQFLVPYLMSSHPGCTMRDAVMLAEYLRDINHQPEQVQDFYPTPSTLSTCMYYTGLDPRTMEPVYIPKSPHEKAMQRALMQFRNPKNYDLVKEALILAERTDLIGFDKNCLIRPTKGSYEGKPSGGRNHSADGHKTSSKNSIKGNKKDASRGSSKNSGKGGAGHAPKNVNNGPDRGRKGKRDNYAKR